MHMDALAMSSLMLLIKMLRYDIVYAAHSLSINDVPMGEALLMEMLR